MGLRVGLGYDVHPFVADAGTERALVLGGVRIEGERGLAGHSDADVVSHALSDALLGALALGDLGDHFSDSDPRWKGADSLRLLATVAEKLRQRGARVVNADVTVIAEWPRLAPHVESMRERLASAIHLPPGRVSVKATRPEGLGALGRGLGVAAMAVALVATSEEEEEPGQQPGGTG